MWQTVIINYLCFAFIWHQLWMCEQADLFLFFWAKAPENFWVRVIFSQQQSCWSNIASFTLNTFFNTFHSGSLEPRSWIMLQEVSIKKSHCSDLLYHICCEYSLKTTASIRQRITTFSEKVPENMFPSPPLNQTKLDLNASISLNRGVWVSCVQ